MDHERFVEIWEGSEGVGPVAAALGISRSYASTIAWRLRRMGVNLKAMRRGPKAEPVDVDGLNKTARGVGV